MLSHNKSAHHLRNWVPLTDSPTVLCQRLTANSRLHVTVTAAGMLRWGSVLAATWVTGELEGNLSTMMTSCCIWSLNISGLWGRKHWWDRQRKREGRGEGQRYGDGGRDRTDGTEGGKGEGILVGEQGQSRCTHWGWLWAEERSWFGTDGFGLKWGALTWRDWGLVLLKVQGGHRG